MPEPELFLLFVRPLNRAGIRYAVTGSVAAIFYGEPRLTHDVDFVVYREGGSEKHLRDIRSMLAVSGDQLDRSALNAWLQRCGLQAEWRLVSETPGQSGL